MDWNPRTTYYYLVCFATLMLSIFGGVQIVRQGLDLAFPSTGYYPSPIDVYQRYQVRPPQGEEAEVPFTREELKQMAEEESERQRRDAWNRTMRELLGSLALLLIALPTYLYHWRQIRQME